MLMASTLKVSSPSSSLQLGQRRHFLTAWRAPGGPKIDQQRLAGKSASPVSAPLGIL
jgi:hypothetical protein